MYYNLFDIPKIFKESFEKYIEQGFNQMLVEYNFKDVTERCQITLKNSIIDRELCFAFDTYDGSPNKEIVSEFVWFSINSEIDKNRRLRLAIYWQLKKGNEYRIGSLINQVKGNTFVERLKNYFEIVKDTLDNDLKEVVEGKKWIDLRYDPRDDYV